MAAQGGLKKKGAIGENKNQGLHNISGAVSAISEINRMDGNHHQYKEGDDKEEKPPIIINIINPHG